MKTRDGITSLPGLFTYISHYFTDAPRSLDNPRIILYDIHSFFTNFRKRCGIVVFNGGFYV